MNNKGGVGKTTSTINLAHALAKRGKRVLAIDMDPQGHLTAGLQLGVPGEGIDEVLLGNKSLADVTVLVRENLELIPAGQRLGEMEFMSEGGAQRGFKLRNALEKKDEKDFILIDCPPSTGLLGMNALFASREVLIPVSSDFLSLQGLSRFVTILQYIEQAVSAKMKRWIVLTRYNERRKLARNVQQKLLEYFPGEIMKTPIRDSVALAESPSFKQTIFEYRAKSNGALDYSSLADDLLEGRTL